jgi:hypothetical protein
MNAKFTTTIIPAVLLIMLFGAVGLYSIKAIKGEIQVEKARDKTIPKPSPNLKPLPKIPSGKPVEELVSEARADLAERLNISQSEITTFEVESILWNDASLGCPEPKKYYAQVITPGYKITLKANGKAYYYHTSYTLTKFCKKDL